MSRERERKGSGNRRGEGKEGWEDTRRGGAGGVTRSRAKAKQMRQLSQTMNTQKIREQKNKRTKERASERNMVE